MKQLYISIGTLIMSLAFLYYADQAKADSLMNTQCNKNCGSVENCTIGADYLASGWTHCFIYENGSCAVYGQFCSNQPEGNWWEDLPPGSIIAP